ncbi:MAG TPA: hypothetical protein G4O03_00420 [Dehalococcoidia bacterium]|nr:hypothetical protein [Dehalococcoidia bacterium]
MARAVFDPVKFIKTRIEAEDAWKEKFRQGKLEIKLEELGSQDKNPFVQVYPEHAKLLATPHLGQQHRMQDLRVIQQYPNRGLSTFIVLPIDFTKPEQVSSYYGAPMDVVADYCVEAPHPEKMPPLVPMILEPEEYLKKAELLELYKPLFQRLHNAGKDDLLVFANRMEDCLTYQKFGIDWTTFKKRQINFWANQGIDKVGTYKRGDLPERKPSEYLGERMAWLEILALEEHANDIKRIVLDEKNVMFACDVASIIQTLHISPILYSHKTTTAVHDPFDSRQLWAVGIPYIETVTSWPVEKALRHLPSAVTLALILAYLAYARFVPAPPELPPQFPYIVSWTSEETKRTLEIALREPDILLRYDQVSLTSHNHEAALAIRDKERAMTTADSFLQLRERIVALHSERFSSVKQAIRAFVRVIPAIGSLWTPEDWKLKWLTRLLEREVQGKGLAGKADQLLELIWSKGLYQEPPPILRYQPHFRIYDLSELITKTMRPKSN